MQYSVTWPASTSKHTTATQRNHFKVVLSSSFEVCVFCFVVAFAKEERSVAEDVVESVEDAGLLRTGDVSTE